MKNVNKNCTGLFEKSSYEEIVNIPSIDALKNIVRLIENFIKNREQAISLLKDINIKVDSQNEMDLNFIHSYILFRRSVLKEYFVISPFDNDKEYNLLENFLLYAHARIKEESLDSRVDIRYRKLLLEVPESGKYKIARKMAKMLILNQGTSDYYSLAKCLKLNLPKNQKLTKTTFEVKKKAYKGKVKNVLRTLKRIWKKLNYSIRGQNQYVEIIPMTTA